MIETSKLLNQPLVAINLANVVIRAQIYRGISSLVFLYYDALVNSQFLVITVVEYRDVGVYDRVVLASSQVDRH